MKIIITIPITLLFYQLQYYSHYYYKFWQYYAKYAYHADKLSHSHSSGGGREGWGGGGGLTSNPLPYHHCSHVSQPKIDQVELLRFYETPVVASRAYVFCTLQRLKKHHEVRSF